MITTQENNSNFLWSKKRNKHTDFALIQKKILKKKSSSSSRSLQFCSALCWIFSRRLRRSQNQNKMCESRGTESERSRLLTRLSCERCFRRGTVWDVLTRRQIHLHPIIYHRFTFTLEGSLNSVFCTVPPCSFSQTRSLTFTVHVSSFLRRL